MGWFLQLLPPVLQQPSSSADKVAVAAAVSAMLPHRKLLSS